MVNNEFVPWDPSSLYNYASPSYFQRPDKRYTLGAFAHYDVSDHVTAYTQLMYMNDQNAGTVCARRVLLRLRCASQLRQPAADRATGWRDGLYRADRCRSYLHRRRNVEGGPRRADIKHDNYRGVFGLKGDIDSAWRYDVSYQYAEVDNNIRNSNYTNTANIANALNVVNDPTLGVVCQSVVDGTDPSCVPWNIFQTGGVTQAATDYIAASYYETSSTDQTVLTGYVQGDLGEYGVKLPWAESGIDVVFGAERRQENLDYNPDDASQRGDIGGLAAALVPVNGGYTVKEAFAEASIPVVQGRRFVEDITLDLGYRYSDYTTDIETDTYKYAGTWTIDNQLKLRASYQRAVRAPNIVETYGPVTGNLFAMDADPCEKAAPGDAPASPATRSRNARVPV